MAAVWDKKTIMLVLESLAALPDCSYSVIARTLGLSRTGISDFARRNGLERRQRHWTADPNRTSKTGFEKMPREQRVANAHKSNAAQKWARKQKSPTQGIHRAPG